MVVIQFAFVSICIVGFVGVGTDAWLHRAKRLQPLASILQALLPKNARALHLELRVQCTLCVGMLKDLWHEDSLPRGILHLPLLRFTRGLIFQSRLICQDEVSRHVGVALLGLLAVRYTEILILRCPYFAGSDRGRCRRQLRR